MIDYLDRRASARRPIRLSLFVAVALSLAASGPAVAQIQQIASRGGAAVQPVAMTLRPIFHSRPGEHPLMPALRWADVGLKQIDSLDDYACTFVKRECVEGKFSPYTHMRLKVRHRPFSVYIHFDGPADERGQEVIYVEGRNDGKLLAHGVGLKAIVGTVALDPASPRALAGGRHGVTSIGILNMTKMLRDQGVQETQYGECEVRFLPGARVSGRGCTCIQMVHPTPRREFEYHMVRVFVDDEHNLPIRFETYDWPSQPGQPPVPLAEYSFLNLKANNGFTDLDFDVRNSAYRFR